MCRKDARVPLSSAHFCNHWSQLFPIIGLAQEHGKLGDLDAALNGALFVFNQFTFSELPQEVSVVAPFLGAVASLSFVPSALERRSK